MVKFPNCCNAHVIHSFGGADNAEYDTEDTVEEMRDKMEAILSGIKKRKLLIAITTDEQEDAEVLLEESGFQSTGWMEKNQHPTSCLKLWWREPEYDPDLPTYWMDYDI